MKKLHPIETSENVIFQNMQGEPAFNWWVPHVLKKRETIIFLVKTKSARYLKKKHKFGVSPQKSVGETYRLDKENGNEMWTREISKEMADVRMAFKLLEDDENIPIGYSFVCYHVIFDVKMENFCRKYRLVSGGHTIETPDTITYTSVVYRENF